MTETTGSLLLGGMSGLSAEHCEGLHTDTTLACSSGHCVDQLHTNQSIPGLTGSQPTKDVVKTCLAYNLILLRLEHFFY